GHSPHGTTGRRLTGTRRKPRIGIGRARYGEPAGGCPGQFSAPVWHRPTGIDSGGEGGTPPQNQCTRTRINASSIRTMTCGTESIRVPVGPPAGTCDPFARAKIARDTHPRSVLVDTTRSLIADL